MKKIKQATLYKFREWLYFYYYSLCATAESGAKFVFSRPSATGAYFAYVLSASVADKGKICATICGRLYVESLPSTVTINCLSSIAISIALSIQSTTVFVFFP